MAAPSEYEPTLDDLEEFLAYAFCNRENESSDGRQGHGDSFECNVRYFLAKHVFPMIGYKGWRGLSVEALLAKHNAWKLQSNAMWTRLKNNNPHCLTTGKPFLKEKWEDNVYN